MGKEVPGKSARSTARDGSLWLRTTRRRRHPVLAERLAVDRVVVGAGITGLTTALLLRRAGLEVALVEAERVAAGTSGSTSAHVTEVPDLSYVELSARLGGEAARTVAAAYRAGLQWIQHEVETGLIRCDLETLPAYKYSEQVGDLEDLAAEAAAARRLGLSVERVESVPLPFKVAGGIRFDGQAQFHPVRYLTGLARGFVLAGGKLFEQTRVTGWEERSDGVRLETDRGTVTAAGLVLATHTPLGFNWIQTELTPWRSYLLALRLREEVPHGLFWDSADPYHYLRDIPEDDGRLLLVGGEDHKTGHEEDTAKRYRDLEEYARQRFAVRSVVSRWSAQLYAPAGELPYIGKSPFSEAVFVATGFDGVGLVGGTVAGLLLADLARGVEPPWAEPFAATRLEPLAAGPTVVRESAANAARYVSDRLASSEAESNDAVPRGEGRLVTLDGAKVAVYRPRSGEPVVRSAVCTHLGCIVRWNTAERSWDCPCHGSRFTPEGQVLSGPAILPLAPVAAD